MISQIAAIYYFCHFLVILPLVSALETPEPLPFSITQAVLGSDDGVGADDPVAFGLPAPSPHLVPGA
jgi:ubiquinol-cytochrome c reductase cytochrome b subunit